MKIAATRQPSLLDAIKVDEVLDSNVIIIGAREYNLDLLDKFYEEYESAKIFALDSETFGNEGAEALYFYYNKVRLIQIGVESGLVLVIDFGGWAEKSRWDEIKNDEKVVKALAVLGEKSFDNTVAIIGVNLSFDFNNLRHHFGIICRQARDLMILSQIIWAGIGAYKQGMTALCAISHGLAGIAGRLGFGDQIDKTEQKSAWGWPLRNAQLNYAAKDVRTLFPMLAVMRRMINEQGLQYTARAECRAVAVFANMQYLGVPVRLDEAQRLLSEQQEILDEQLLIFDQYYPGVQHTSQPQVLEVLQNKFPDLNIENVAKETLVTLDCHGVEALLKAKKAEAQVKSCQTILDYAFDGSIHALFNQISPTATGRSTSKAFVSVKGAGKRNKITIGLQAQNVNKKIKDIFGFNPDSDMILGVYDGSAMHQRIATEFSKDPNLVAGYIEDKDLHSLLAADIAKVLRDKKEFWDYLYISSKRKETYTDEQGNKKPTELAKKAEKYRDLAKKVFYSCVPMDTLALTKKGWTSYENLKIGEDILAYNPATGLNEWTPCLEKFKYKDCPVTEWRVGSSRIFRSTDTHRWVGKKRKRKSFNGKQVSYYEDCIFETREVSTEYHIKNVAPTVSGEGVKLNKLVNKHTEDSSWLNLVINMTQDERWLFFSANIATDGHMTKHDIAIFSQHFKQSGLIEAMRLCGYMLGFNVTQTLDHTKKLAILRFRKNDTTCTQQLKVKTLENQDVWCVNTAFGTWVTRTEDYITITGNSLNGSGAGKILMGLHQLGFAEAVKEDAKKIYESFYELYGVLVSFIKSNHEAACANKYRFDFPDTRFRKFGMHERDYGVIRTLTGRLQYLEFEKGKYGDQVSYTKATGNLWQMCEGDMLKMWMAEMQDKFWETPEWGANIINMIHDEVLVKCKRAYKDEVGKFIVDKMVEVWSRWVRIIPVVPDTVLANPACGMVNLWSEGK